MTPDFPDKVIKSNEDLAEKISKQATEAMHNVLNQSDTKMDQKLDSQFEQRQTVIETLEQLNTTEVYEEPFIRIYVRPLCEGNVC
ncbi:unnamed protein product [Thelazia callipaeda]|uniref:V-SNARE coiled-coil homology domain-containing protein n=1 Tax=Thelazia callipaeda TaxID=103827 RepID=A0A0N5D5K6_THECL|nr:unnamed protein product [Thelazia callipaeda]